VQRLMSTRGGTLIVGGAAALLAGTILLVFISQYRDTVNASTKPVTVLVAKQVIAKGTPGDLVGSQSMFQTTTVPRDQVKSGAIADPSVLRGRVATDAIFPGQQLTTSDFETKPSGDLNYQITGTQRAVAIPLDSAHGLIGLVHTGDHVDVMAGFNVVPIARNGVPTTNSGQPRPVLKRIIQNALVLSAPSSTPSGIGAGTSSNVVLRLSDSQAADVAFAVDNGKVWLTLRPQSGGKQTTPGIVTIETELLGIKPITALRSFGGRS
jgi:Flp pilus assembly protein CpaB